jgi:hypothetical protein
MIRHTIDTFFSIILSLLFDFHNGLMGCCEISVLLLWSKAINLGLTIPLLFASHLFLPAWEHLEIMSRIESLVIYSFRG